MHPNSPGRAAPQAGRLAAAKVPPLKAHQLSRRHLHSAIRTAQSLLRDAKADLAEGHASHADVAGLREEYRTLVAERALRHNRAHRNRREIQAINLAKRRMPMDGGYFNRARATQRGQATRAYEGKFKRGYGMSQAAADAQPEASLTLIGRRLLGRRYRAES